MPERRIYFALKNKIGIGTEMLEVVPEKFHPS